MSTNQKTKPLLPAFEKINSIHKLLICLALAVVVYLVVQVENIDFLTHLMIGWDTFSVCMVVMTWITFFITTAKQIRIQSKVQDPNRSIIFIIILICTLASFLTVVLLILTKKDGESGPSWKMPVAVGGMLFSWILIHTSFTLRYAHIFYGDHESNPNTHAGGLEFPGDELPDYLDFAYFSFVLGMTFQVSDVQITSKRFRRLALLHGFISFVFDTTLLALTINILA
ncbi:MAG: DUF1345 domain-containing protein [Ginsengibacter sp.]|jgi:uncharacterized membrane protein